MYQKQTEGDCNTIAQNVKNPILKRIIPKLYRLLVDSVKTDLALDILQTYEGKEIKINPSSVSRLLNMHKGRLAVLIEERKEIRS